MFCGNCYHEIPKGQNCYKHQTSNQHFCSLNCLTDWLTYRYEITLETIGKSEVDYNSNK